MVEVFAFDYVDTFRGRPQTKTINIHIEINVKERGATQRKRRDELTKGA
jgi:hypothetical protein